MLPRARVGCQSGNQFSNSSWEFLRTDDCGWDCGYAFVKGAQSKQFHIELFERYKKLGMSNYEQDFMVTNFLKTTLYRQDLAAYEDWAVGLDQAAAVTGVPVQFCMAMPSDIMMSTKLNWVTNARASNDYAEGDNLVRVPGAGLLMWSLGMRPSKDNFWTANASDSPYQHGQNSPANPGSNCELNAIVSVLSTGPVGISDKAGGTNATIAMATCDTAGTLLQPSKPLTPSDRTYAPAGRWPRLQGQLALWNSYTAVGNATLAWFSVSVVTNARAAGTPVELVPAVDFYPAPSPGALLVHREWHESPARCRPGADAVSTGCVSLAPPNRTASSRSAAASDLKFDLFVSSPVLAGGWVLLGEIGKYVSVSEARFASVVATAATLTVQVHGAPAEVVSVTALRAGAGRTWSVVVRSVTLGAAGTAELRF